MTAKELRAQIQAHYREELGSLNHSIRMNREFNMRNRDIIDDIQEDINELNARKKWIDSFTDDELEKIINVFKDETLHLLHVIFFKKKYFSDGGEGKELNMLYLISSHSNTLK